MKPRFLFVDVNLECNLRCNHCNFFERTDPETDKVPSILQLGAVFRDFAALGGESVVICGGEPMLAEDRYYGVCGEARAAGLRVLSVVNGTRLQKGSQWQRCYEEGPTEISVSFDDFRPSEHDFFRGVTGSWKLACQAVRGLVYVRGGGLNPLETEQGPLQKVNVMGLIHAGNYLELPRFYDFVLNDLRADKLKLNFLQPSFGVAGGSDSIFWKYGSIDPDRLASVLFDCERMFGFKYRDKWVTSILAYVVSLRQGGRKTARGWLSGVQLEEDLCNSYERNIMVDVYGRPSMCFSDCEPRGNLLRAPGDLLDYWNTSLQARSEKRETGCRAVCGISHSVRRESCYEVQS